MPRESGASSKRRPSLFAAPVFAGSPAFAGDEDREVTLMLFGLRGGPELSLHAASVETLKAVLDAFNKHDLDRIMSFFSADCVLEMPRGSDPWGARYVGSDAVREGLRTRFAGIPDV